MRQLIQTETDADASPLLQCEVNTYDWNRLKMEINNTIWMYAPECITLGEAEEAACRCFRYLIKRAKGGAR